MNGFRAIAPAIGLLLGVLPAMAHADVQPQNVCESFASPQGGIASNVQVYTSSAAQFQTSLKAYKDAGALIGSARCQSSPNALYIQSFMQLWNAWLLHASNKSWEDPAQSAADMLTKCATAYVGTWQGTSCGFWQEKAVEWKLRWERDATMPVCNAGTTTGTEMYSRASER